MFFEQDGTPGYVDFQAYARCCALHDVNYMIVGSMTPAERRKNDRQLLKAYLTMLEQKGVRRIWAFDEAWERYRCHTMHGLMWFSTPTSMQPTEVIAANTERFAHAAVDYELASALGI